MNTSVDTAALESVGVAWLLLPALVVSHVFLFRRRKADSLAYAQLLPAALIYAAAWFVAMLAVGLSSASQVIGGICTIAFLCLAYGQVFSLTVRGFSLRIIVDIQEHGTLSREQIMAGYSEGRGVDWMLEQRLAALESLGLVRREGNATVVIRPCGLGLGLMGVWTKRLLKTGSGG